MDSVAFAAAVASDALTTGVLIYVLKASRTGFKKYAALMRAAVLLPKC